MLQGEDGFQAVELNGLVKELRDEIKPEVVHISNALLLGLVRSVKRELNVPVVCSLQDEDTLLHKSHSIQMVLPERFYSEGHPYLIEIITYPP